VFDRIRENVPRMPRAAFTQIVNRSMSEVLTRSLATSFCTLLPILALLFFGGDTLKDFAFALLIGVTSGAYSSIFVAAPLLTMWKEREPEYARRKSQDGVAPLDGDGVASVSRVRLGRRGAPDAGTIALEQSEQALAAEPTPALLDVAPAESATAAARREKRRQRRRTRPHGRAR
jgi:SecD/SecF fusion protein